MTKKSAERMPVAGTWYNQHGSELRLDVDANGRLSGRFRSRSGLAREGEPCRVTGYFADGLIVFAVDFGRFDSLASWTGHVVTEGGEPRIRACWHMTVGVPMVHPERELWRATWTGEDEFRRSAPLASELEESSRELVE